jgi:hypothetical protein
LATMFLSFTLSVNSMFMYLGTVMVIGTPLHQTIGCARELC